MKRSSIVCRRLVVLLMIFSALANGEIASTKESEDTSTSSFDMASEIDTSDRQPASSVSTPSAAPSRGAKVMDQIVPQLRKRMDIFFSAESTTSQEEILAQCPHGSYVERNWDGRPMEPHVLATLYTSGCEIHETYQLKGDGVIAGMMSLRSYTEKKAVQQFLRCVIQKLAASGEYIKILQRPKGDGSPPDMILDWQSGDFGFSLSLGIGSTPRMGSERYYAILIKAQTVEKPYHNEIDLQGMEPLTEPAAALAAWGISMPEGWRPGKDMQETKENE